MTNDTTLIQVSSPHFCAGIILKEGICIEAAPILKWAVKKDWEFLSVYFKKKGWETHIYD